MVYKEYRMTAASSPGWKLPFNLAVLLHLLLLSSALLLPKYLHKNPVVPESYTVDLISINEPPVATPSSPPPAATAPPKAEPPVKIQKLKEVVAKNSPHCPCDTGNSEDGTSTGYFDQAPETKNHKQERS